MPAATEMNDTRLVTPPQPEYDHSPVIVFYELTRACDLVCKHCRASAQKRANPLELKPEQSLALVDQLATFPIKPMLVLTGGDPLKREDLFNIIEHSVSRGIETSITPSVTPLMTRDAIRRFKESGISRMAISLDGKDAQTHDTFRGVPGTFDQSLQVVRTARELGIPVQINTTLTPGNYDQIEEMAEVLRDLDIVLWSLFLIIPVGRATDDMRLTAEQHEAAFERMWKLAQTMPYGIKTTEGMHYRRFVLQQVKAARAAGNGNGNGNGKAAPPFNGIRNKFSSVNDGKGILFLSHKGEIQPSGFFPVICGKFPDQSIVETYQNHPLFLQLRDSKQLEGKCGMCEYRNICGGSRARSFAVTGNPVASDPDCIYIPPAYTKHMDAQAAAANDPFASQ